MFLLLTISKWMLCVPIGRDLVRVLHDLVSIPEFAQLWDDLLNHPQKLSPRFTGKSTRKPMQKSHIHSVTRC
jgi:hypothetical protein